MRISVSTNCHRIFNIPIVFESKKGAVLQAKDLSFKRSEDRNRKTDFFIFGCPTINGKRSTERISSLFDVVSPSWSDFDGEFLVVGIDKDFGSLTIANDRFASIPIYYAQCERQFIASNEYLDIVRFLQTRGRWHLKAESLFTFVAFHRLFGTETYDQHSHCLEPGSILKIENDRLTKQRYFVPDYAEEGGDVETWSERLCAAVKRSMQAKLSDGKRPALLLSGGLDSRVVLAASQQAMPCITMVGAPNKESAIAEKCARIKGCPHHLIKRSPDYYVDIMDRAVACGGGQYVYNHAHFFDLFCNSEVSEQVDILLQGHGFDYLFQGMYYPKRFKSFLGKKIFLYELDPLSEDESSFCEQALHKFPTGLKSLPLENLLVKKHKIRCIEAIREKMAMLYREAVENGADVYKAWHHLIFHSYSRHYTNLNLQSINAEYPTRTICFQNEIMNLSNHMPVRLQINATVLKRVLKMLSPQLAHVTYANTGAPMDAHWALVTLLQKYNALRDMMRDSQSSQPHPWLTERSWPDSGALIRYHEGLRELSLSLAKSDYLNSLNLFDMRYINRCIEDHVAGKADYHNLILALVTLNRFLFCVDSDK